jgi:hypothetical protein
MSNDINPYAPPQTYNEAVVVVGESSAEQIRRAHLNHEASVQSIGYLYLIGGVLMLIGAIIGVSTSRGISLVELLLLAFYGVMGSVAIALCFGLNKLQPWTRIVGSIFAGFGLLAFPCGTLINAYVLWLLLSAKGSMVFSPQYKQIIAETPHIKYKTSIVVWILLGLLLLLLAMGVLAALFGA